MFRRAVQHVRGNAVAWLALFVAMGGSAYAANTVGSADIIDESILSADIKNGEVKTDDVLNNTIASVDIATGAVANSDLVNGAITEGKLALNSVGTTRVVNGSLLGADVAPNTLTGAQIAESSLGKVNDADTVDGLDSTQLQGAQGDPGPAGPALFAGVLQGASLADVCTTANEWRECATTTVSVPADRIYYVMIDSAGSYRNGGAANRVRICSSVRLSTTPFVGTDTTVAGCPNQPTGITLGAGELKNSATHGYQTLYGGAGGANYVVSTAVRPDAALTFDSLYDYGVMNTLVTVAEVPAAAASAAASSKPAKLTRPGR